VNEDEQKRAFKAPISGTVYGTNCESHHQAVQLSHLVSDGNPERRELTQAAAVQDGSPHAPKRNAK